MFGRRLSAFFIAAAMTAACAANDAASKSTTPANGGATDSEIPQSIGAARAELDKTARDVELAVADCQAACKALASLERAANHLCLVSEPEECSDARVRVDRAKRAVQAQCGGQC